MSIIGPLIFFVVILGAGYFVLGRVNPDAQKHVTAWIVAAAAAVVTWLSGLFDNLGGMVQ